MLIHKTIDLPEALTMTKVKPMNANISNSHISLLATKWHAYLHQEDAKKAADICMHQNDVNI